MRLADRLSDTPYTVETMEADRHSRYRFVLSRDGEIGRGTHFTGAGHIRPWLEFQPAREPDRARDAALFDALTDVLAPGGHVMVHYLDDAVTAEGLTADVPPPATPLGAMLWQAGCRWFKDWYFTEGWMEGDQKLQGNLPVDADHRDEREAEMQDRLAAFLATDPDEPYRALADEVLSTL